MVQQVTDVRFGGDLNGFVPVSPVLNPDPQRPNYMFQTGCTLSTLDTSSYLLDPQVVQSPVINVHPPSKVHLASSYFEPLLRAFANRLCALPTTSSPRPTAPAGCFASPPLLGNLLKPERNSTPDDGASSSMDSNSSLDTKGSESDSSSSYGSCGAGNASRNVVISFRT
ncbi:unnamed protein product [Fraxinus pennsylvanica]|uniref:Uncharacterized protein n=1 Tax=Fraxinus pennsylvanica TaxID=56036 RepID=A0AAD2DPX2_9LAMI|nr:unnamed protein product [Fraxinus pennsylvanica]